MGSRLHKEHCSVHRCLVWIPKVRDIMSQKSFEEWRNHTLARLLVVVVICRAHHEFVHCFLVARELLSTMAPPTEVLECWVEEPNVETTIFGRTTTVKGVLLLLFCDCTHFRCGRGGGCFEPEADGSPMDWSSGVSPTTTRQSNPSIPSSRLGRFCAGYSGLESLRFRFAATVSASGPGTEG